MIPFKAYTRHFTCFMTMCITIVVFEGCGPSSPRFTSTPKKPKSEQQAPKQIPRFTSKEKEAEAERKEDDKKVDSTEIETIKAGKRNFKTEKNEAIKPLDQSRMMREISKYMGVPYVHGSASEQGMDCSGYTMIVYKNALKIQLPRSSAEQYKMGRPVKLSELKFGDLVFFNTTNEPASHVGIYIGDDLFAHASVSLGVTISSLQSTYYQKRYIGARRIVE